MSVKKLTDGNPFKLIISFMFPVFLGNLLQQFYHIVDTLIVGRVVGIEALAAVGATGPIIFFAITFIFASTHGFTLITAQKFGAKDYKMLRKSFAASLILSGLLTVIITLLCLPFTVQMLKLLQTPDNIMHDANTYLLIMFAGIIAAVFYNLSSNVVRALGDSKTPLLFLGISTVLNIITDILFVVKFGWGIAGVGWATVIAEGISTILCVRYMLLKFPILRLKLSDWKISWDFLYAHIKVGIPMGIQMSVLALGILVLQYVLNSFGYIAVAAFTAAVKVEQTFAQLFLALGITVSVFTAQNFGAKKLSRVISGIKTSVLISAVFYIVSFMCIRLYSNDMISWFSKEKNYEMIAYANQYLHIMMFFFIFFGLLMVFKNVLQGMGRVRVPLASGITELIARTVCALVLGYYYGFTGVCLATPVAWLAASAVLYMGYIISLKKQIKIIKNR